MAQAQAAILIQARDQATQNINQIFVNINQQLGKTAQGQTQAAAAADKHKISIVDLAAKLYLVQVGMRNVIESLERMYELAKLGAQAQQQALAFEKLAEGAGASAKQIEALRKASAGTISDLELYAAASRALVGTQGELRKALSDSTPKLLEIAKAASDLSPAGITAEKAFDDITSGIRRNSKMILDNLGLVVSLQTANENYAEKVGKTVDQLTAEEKQMALLDETLRQGNILIDQASGLGQSLTDRYERLEAQAKNVQSALGIMANTLGGPLVDGLSESLESTYKFFLAMQELTQLSPEAADAVRYVSAAFTGFLQAVDPIIPLIMVAGKGLDVLTQIIERYSDKLDGAESKQAAFTKEVEKSTPVVDEFAEIVSSEEFADKWSKTVDKLLEKQADLNREWSDAMQDWEADSIDIANDLNDKLMEIQQEAMDDRADAWADFSDRMEDLQYQLADRMREIQHDLTMSQRNEDDSYDDRKRELERRKYETVRDFAQKQEALLKDVNEAKTAEEKAAAEERLKVAQREMQDKLDDIDYDLSELKRKHEREKTQIDERYRWEQERFAEHNARQQQELQNDLNAKLEKIQKAEVEATARANEESEKRRVKALEDLEATKKEIDEKFKQAWLDAMLAVVPEGSKLHNMLEIAKLKTMGATDETLAWRDSLLEVGRTAQGLASLMGSLGIPMSSADYWRYIAPYNNSTTSPGRASGGGVEMGKSYLVGERGPEMFTPSGGGMVIPNTGGGGNTIQVIVQAGAFLGSQSDASRFGDQLVPVLAKALQKYNINLFAGGSRRTSSR